MYGKVSLVRKRPRVQIPSLALLQSRSYEIYRTPFFVNGEPIGEPN